MIYTPATPADAERVRSLVKPETSVGARTAIANSGNGKTSRSPRRPAQRTTRSSSLDQVPAGSSLVSSDELIGNVVEVVADDLRLRTDPQNIVADTFDQRRLPARRDGAKRVPCVAGDETEPGRLSAKLFLDITVSLARWLVVLHAVRTESSFKQIDDAAMLELAAFELRANCP